MTEHVRVETMSENPTVITTLSERGLVGSGRPT
jgi:hypothetical protein